MPFPAQLSTPPEPVSRLQTLPPELRYQIYKYLLAPPPLPSAPITKNGINLPDTLGSLPSDRHHPLDSFTQPVTLQTGTGPLTGVLPTPCPFYTWTVPLYTRAILRTLAAFIPLLQTSRFLYEDALPIFDNHFLPLPNLTILYSFLRSLGRPRRQALHRLQFTFHPFSGDATGMPKQRDMELAVTCMKLIRRECKSLRQLWVRIDEGFLKWHMGLCWNDGERLKKNSALWGGLGVVAGMRELRGVRGVKDVRFLPGERSWSFTKRCWEEIEGWETEMRKERRITAVATAEGKGGKKTKAKAKRKRT